jgi:hypothetical protein
MKNNIYFLSISDFNAEEEYSEIENFNLKNHLFLMKIFFKYINKEML